ncbi:MAG: hypothetical protein AAFR47_17370 [Pseudomonadota bacterium]
MNVESDLIFVIGMICGLLAIPPLIGAFSEGRTPRTAAIMIMISAGLIVTAVLQNPGGYSFEEAPDVFFRVIAGLLN